MLKVHFCHIDRDLSNDELHRFLPCVSVEKRERIIRSLDTKNKYCILLSELLVRAVLANELKLPSNSFAFKVNANGKPGLLEYPGLEFNISHSGKYIVCAISDVPVGINVEQVTKYDYIKIAKRFFSEKEKSYIDNFHNTEAQSIAFAEIWTMKEAFVKREGLGLTIPLQSFCVFSLSGALFHQVMRNTDAVCYVCTSYKEINEVNFLTSVDELIAFISSPYLL